MPMPTSGALPSARAAPMVTKPTCSDMWRWLLAWCADGGTSPPGALSPPVERGKAGPGWSTLLEGGVEGQGGGFEVDLATELGRLTGPVLAIHAGVLPLH